MKELLDRFLKYVSFDTQSDELSGTHPSTAKQRLLAECLAEELKALGVSNVIVSDTSYVYARIPATPGLEAAEPLGLIAHMDTALEVSGANVRPQVIENWNGTPIPLGTSGNTTTPDLRYKAHTIITTDGTTLLGADDKAGVAIIVTAAAQLLASSTPHGPVCIAFTPDEEIGEGTACFDAAAFGARFGYTLDGGTINLMETENFNAASADITINGKVYHPGGAYHRLVNALTLSREFCSSLPPQQVPEETRNRDGFFYLNNMSGNSGTATMHFLIRDFEAPSFAYKKQLIQSIAAQMNSKYGEGTVTVQIKEQYANMKRHLDRFPQIAEAAKTAIASVGLTPQESLIRGGTDGAHLAEIGVFCPNLGDGCHNAHGIYEYAVLDEMEKGVQIVLALAETFTKLKAEAAQQPEATSDNRPVVQVRTSDGETVSCRMDGSTTAPNGTTATARSLSNESVEITVHAASFIRSIGLSFAEDVFAAETPVFTADGLGTMESSLAKPKFGSFFMMAKSTQDSQWLLIGVADRGADISCFQFENGRLFAGWLPERTLHGSFKRKLFVWKDKDPQKLTARYENAVREMIPELKAVAMDPPSGWNSWDYYSAAISMDSIKAEMAAINASSLKGKLRYFTLDMGWENAWGDWSPNGRFPSSLEEIASTIRDYGFLPGLWIAPMQVESLTEAARFHHEYLLKGSDGQPILTDTSSPVGTVALLNLFDDAACELVHDWFSGFYNAGFRLFKIDYLYRDFLACLSQSPDNQGVGTYVQRLYSIIRSAIGPDARVINCGSPKEAAAGFADIARTGYDIHNFWGHIRKCTQQIVGHHWQNRLLWVNDPDFAICRTAANTIDDAPLNMPYHHRPYGGDNDFWMAGPEANGTELRTWLSIVRLCAGNVCNSDSITALAPDGIGTLSMMFPPLAHPAQPLDMFTEKLPRYWRGDGVLGVFNWSDEPIHLPLSHLPSLPDKLCDFWTGETVSKRDGIRLVAHQGTILEFA